MRALGFLISRWWAAHPPESVLFGEESCFILGW